MRWRERTTYQVDDRVLVVNRAGSISPDSPLIVLVHGIGAGPSYFERLVEAVGSRARVEVVELPGHASSPKPAKPMKIADHSGLLLHYLDATHREPIRLVGHSMGAQVVARVASAAPAKIEHLFLLGPVVDPAAPTAFGQAARLALDTLFESPGANRGVFRDYLRCGPRWYTATLPAMLGFDTAAEAAAVGAAGVRTSLIRGGRDPIASAEWCRRLASLAGASEPLEVEGSAHVVMWTAAHTVARAILRAAP